MKTSPLCADCQHFKAAPGDALCTRRGTIRLHDHATGQSREVHWFCQTTFNERNSILLPWRCGPSARHFTPAEVAADA